MYEMFGFAIRRIVHFLAVGSRNSKVESVNPKAVLIARKATLSLGLPYKELTPGHWHIIANEHHGFVVQMELRVLTEAIAVLAYFTVAADPDWVTRGVMQELLILNHGLARGSFRLNETKAGMAIVLGHFCALHTSDDQYVSSTASSVLGKMQETLVDLFERDLIVMPPKRKRRQK